MATKISEKISTKESDPESVDKFLDKLKHPMKDELEALRKIIASADKSVGEEIAWNAPAFFYSGKMKPFKPKEYKRHIVVSNFFKKDSIRLIFLNAASLRSKLLEGDYPDGRRLAAFGDMKEVKANKKELQKIVKALVTQIKKENKF